MKLTIDTTNKIIEFEGTINLVELINELTKLNINQSEYSIKSKDITYYYQPTIQPYFTQPYN